MYILYLFSLFLSLYIYIYLHIERDRARQRETQREILYHDREKPFKGRKYEWWFEQKKKIWILLYTHRFRKMYVKLLDEFSTFFPHTHTPERLLQCLNPGYTGLDPA